MYTVEYSTLLTGTSPTDTSPTDTALTDTALTDTALTDTSPTDTATYTGCLYRPYVSSWGITTKSRGIYIPDNFGKIVYDNGDSFIGKWNQGNYIWGRYTYGKHPPPFIQINNTHIEVVSYTGHFKKFLYEYEFNGCGKLTYQFNNTEYELLADWNGEISSKYSNYYIRIKNENKWTSNIINENTFYYLNDLKPTQIDFESLMRDYNYPTGGNKSHRKSKRKYNRKHRKSHRRR